MTVSDPIQLMTAPERIQEPQLELLEHLPYGTDLSPCDLHMFGLLKTTFVAKVSQMMMMMMRMTTTLKQRCRKWLRDIGFYASGFDALAKR
jgi:hypothetical protein